MTIDRKTLEGLRLAGLLADTDLECEALTGGVSCEVWKVETPAGPVVVKRPLERLKVEADWYAPVERGAAEVRWLKRAAQVDQSLVPEVLAELPDFGFAMRFVSDALVWKDELIAGRVDLDFAANVGRSIAAVHSATANSPSDRAVFSEDAMFHALRIEPFLLHVAQNDHSVSGVLQALAAELSARKMVLVHGDISPKNILMTDKGPVFLDAECAVYGDPAFDLSFCVTHLLLKSVWLDDERLRAAADALVAAYCAGVDWEDHADLLDRAGVLTAALLLARIDGKSPAPYLTEPAQRDAICNAARRLLLAPVSLAALIAHWERIDT